MRWSLRAWLVLCLLLSLPPSAAAAQSTATLRCRLEAATLAVGADTTLIIEVADVANLYGYQLKLNYDAARVQIQDGDSKRSGVNLALGSFLKPDFIVWNETDNAAGSVALALTQINPSPARNGSGELARAVVRRVAAGAVSFTFAEVILSDVRGMALTQTVEGCTLAVGAGGQETATPTAEETVAPSPTPAASTTAAPTSVPASTPISTPTSPPVSVPGSPQPSSPTASASPDRTPMPPPSQPAIKSSATAAAPAPDEARPGLDGTMLVGLMVVGGGLLLVVAWLILRRVRS
jgi:hypothetical protein